MTWRCLVKQAMSHPLSESLTGTGRPESPATCNAPGHESCQACTWRAATVRSTTSSTDAMAPAPVSPQASVLLVCAQSVVTHLQHAQAGQQRACMTPTGGMTWKPRPVSTPRCCPVKGWSHIMVFMAGATKQGLLKSQALHTQVSRLSHRPCMHSSSFSRSALAGVQPAANAHLCNLCQGVCRQGCNQQAVCPLAQLDVGHRVSLLLPGPPICLISCSLHMECMSGSAAVPAARPACESAHRRAGHRWADQLV